MSEVYPYLEQALNSLEEPWLLLNSQNSLIFANDAFYSFLDLRRPAVGELEVSEFWPDLRHINLSVHDVSCEFRLRRGEVFNVKLVVNQLKEGARLVRIVAGLSRSESRNSFHTQRLETLGMLAGGVAHDFNNILTGVLGHITYLKTILPGSGPHLESLRCIEDGARKGSSMTQEILNFSKLDIAEKAARVNLCDLVKRTCHLLRGAISPEYSLEYTIPSSMVTVLGVEGKLAQVLVNLVINSRDAITTNGWIRVMLELVNDEHELAEAFGRSELYSKHYVRLSVSDNGHGISADVVKRMFEPYFSTKKDKGTGLGLSTVEAIVHQLGGAITVTSQIGSGTTISVYLATVDYNDQEVAEVAVENHTPVLQGGTEGILVVDDDYPVRNVLSVSLEHLGYKVEVASSGMEAIEKYNGIIEGFDLVILDMIMPALSGDEVFFQLRKIDPEVKVLIISGYTSEQAVQNILANGGLAFIQKPFTIEELSKKVRECLDG